MFFGSRIEKEQRVIELYQQGKTMREIAHEVHMSFANIGSIIRKSTGDPETTKDEEKEKQQAKLPSNDILAFKLFLHGKRPVDVAVKLDLSASEINRVYQDFWKLKRLHKLTVVYKEIEPYLSSFLKLFKIIKKNSISELEIVNAIKYANELPHLQSEVQRLRDEVQDLEDKKDRCKADLLDLQVEISYSKNTLDLFQSVLDHKKQQIANMNEKLSWP